MALSTRPVTRGDGDSEYTDSSETISEASSTWQFDERVTSGVRKLSFIEFKRTVDNVAVRPLFRDRDVAKEMLSFDLHISNRPMRIDEHSGVYDGIVSERAAMTYEPLTPLGEALDECIERCQHGADPNHLNRYGSSALTWAAEQGNLNAVRILVSAGVDIDQATREGNTALLQSSGSGFEDVVDYCLAKGANVNARNEALQTPLIRAAEAGHLSVVRRILREGRRVDLDARDQFSQTALSLAQLWNSPAHIEMATLLDASLNRNVHELVARAVSLQSNGRIEEAMHIASSIVQNCARESDCVDGLQIVATCHLRQGNLDDANAALAQALEFTQGQARIDIWSSLGEVQRRRGLLHEAIATLQKALHHFGTAVAKDQGNAAGRLQLSYNLGVALEDAQDHWKALELYKEVLSHEPGHLDAAVNAANVLAHKGLAGQGAKLLATAAAAAASAPYTHGKLSTGELTCKTFARIGLLWQQASQLSAAEAAYKKTLACIDGQDKDATRRGDQESENIRVLAIGNLGAIFQARGQLEDAIRLYEEAIRLPGAHSGLLNNAGACLWYLGHHERAREYYMESLRLDPGGFEPRVNLAAGFYEDGDLTKAEEQYQLARESRPGMVDARLALMDAPIMPAATNFSTLLFRSQQGLERWAASVVIEKQARPLINPVSEIEWLPFYWVYQGVNEYIRQGIVSGLYSDIAYRVPGPARPAAIPQAEMGAPISVGFISKFWHDNHAHGQLLAGVLSALASDADFEPWVLSLVNVRGPPSQEVIDAVGDSSRVVDLSSDASTARERLDALNLDVLVFVDTMSEAVTHFLARERHALVQVAFWGNPLTSGSPQMDFFVSGDKLEPSASEEPHYHEQVVRLRGLGIHYNAIPIPPLVLSALQTREECSDTIVFAVLQSAFKLHPAFDLVLAAILDRVPDEYLALLARADIVLHPFPFGGSKTSADALLLGLPLVVMDGAFLRGRMAPSFLRHMNMTDLLAKDADAYVEIAVRLGTDCALRRETSREVARRAPAIFNDARVLSEWKAFLARAAGQARRELELDQDPEATLARRLASVAANRHGRLREARQHLERLAELFPFETAVQSDYGAVLQQLGLLGRATAHLRFAVELDESNVEARNNLAVTLHEAGMLAEAESHYRAAIRLQPFDATAVCNLGDFYRDWEKPDLAIELYLRHLGISHTMRRDGVSYFTPRGADATWRQLELQHCLRTNAETQGVFDEIHLLLEDAVEDECFSGLASGAKIKQVVIGRRLTFADAISYANQNLQGAICILSNADIFFDSSVERFHALLPTGASGENHQTVAALLRWELSPSPTTPESAEFHFVGNTSCTATSLPSAKTADWYLYPRIDSQDAWAFRAPLQLPQRAVERLQFPLGVPRCDNRAAKVLMEEGIHVRNFAVDVKSYHVHRAKERPQIEPIHGDGAFVQLSLPRFHNILKNG
ncbi:Ankyrin repeat domain-containing protein 1 [Hondaea fermentalgiana]|uniref:protein O-GlcNAc transferase n=1 Tax=Hondaea fermentalgiana TaxID=2315210 RepID=A0A2R5GNG6_9STRA|nr:Ankyrin repeat domain-containing protein 1 [Hondaea fermentalgiana]|eukprot:GBG29414.1 Ankyrin repeat domain-containing protein 1 [Hondaea fermentalgiana]